VPEQVAAEAASAAGALLRLSPYPVGVPGWREAKDSGPRARSNNQLFLSMISNTKLLHELAGITENRRHGRAPPFLTTTVAQRSGPATATKSDA
jgi:hypothetical protein